jgi:hypothetical protein
VEQARSEGLVGAFLVDEHEGIVRGRVELDLDLRCDMGDRVADRAEDRRRTAKRVRVLHFAGHRVGERAAGEQLAEVRGARDGAGVGPLRVDARVERARRAEQCLDAERRGDLCVVHQQRGVVNGECQERRRGLAPFVIASPSLAPSVSRGISARAIASEARSRSPRNHASPAGPSMITSPRWLSGARSPDEPQLPCEGTTGVTPALSIATSVSTIAGWHPDAPRASAFARSSIMARTTSSPSGSPTPAACERTRFDESFDERAGSMRTRASDPKPVFTP